MRIIFSFLYHLDFVCCKAFPHCLDEISCLAFGRKAISVYGSLFLLKEEKMLLIVYLSPFDFVV